MNSGLQQAHDLPLPPLVFLVAALLAAAALLAVKQLMDSTRAPPSDGALLIVEPRPHPLLKPVIDAFSARVPSTWVLYVVHGRGNGDYARRAAEQVAETRRVVYLQLDADNLSAAQYNALFKTPAFWDRVQAEHVLVFQTDAMPCAGALDMSAATNLPDLSGLDSKALMKLESEIAEQFMGGVPWGSVTWALVNLAVWLALWPLTFMQILPLWAAFPIATACVAFCSKRLSSGESEFTRRPNWSRTSAAWS